MNEFLRNVHSKAELLVFINVLIKDLNELPEKWEDMPVIAYLESIQSWIMDMEGFYINTKQDNPKEVNLNFIATLLYVGKIYE